MTQSINSRHRKQGPTNCNCAVGGEQTVMHVSWHCAHHQQNRLPIQHVFPQVLLASSAFRYAGVLTPTDNDLKDHVLLIQTTLVKIWRQHIRMYIDNVQDSNAPDAPLPDHNQQPTGITGPQGIQENGHHIIAIPSGGVLCCKCGKHTYEPKHRRLKISKVPCRQAHLAAEFWTTKPSMKNNPNHHLDNFAAILKIDCEHELA